MGMYTSAYDKDGKEWQFKTGDDNCDSYEVDVPNPKSWGSVEDGVYSAIGNNGWAAVAMKGNMCIAIVPYPDSETWEVPDDFLDNVARCYGLPESKPEPKKKIYLKGECEDTMPPCQSLDKALMQSTSESAAGSTPTPTN